MYGVENTSGLPAHCGGPYDLTPTHTISCWENKPTTLAEMAILTYLTDRLNIVADKTLLHVGVGNGSLFSGLQHHLSKYIGLTISVPEQEKFMSSFPTAQNSTIILANKHDPRSYSRIPLEFDIVVDVNLKSFTCCSAHFDSFFALCRDRLRPRGQIITAESGLNYGWPGNTQIAFTPGANPDPTIGQHRVLGVSGLHALAQASGLSIESVMMKGIRHSHGAPPGEQLVADERIWFLTRP